MNSRNRLLLFVVIVAFVTFSASDVIAAEPQAQEATLRLDVDAIQFITVPLNETEKSLVIFPADEPVSPTLADIVKVLREEYDVDTIWKKEGGAKTKLFGKVTPVTLIARSSNVASLVTEEVEVPTIRRTSDCSHNSDFQSNSPGLVDTNVPRVNALLTAMTRHAHPKGVAIKVAKNQPVDEIKQRGVKRAEVILELAVK